jgi:hypothetical protein
MEHTRSSISDVILFGALFTAAVCWALGRMMFHRLGIELKQVEHDLLAALTGAAILSLAVFLLCVVKAARTPVFLAFGLTLPLVRKTSQQRDALPPLPRFWKFLFAAAFTSTRCSIYRTASPLR